MFKPNDADVIVATNHTAIQKVCAWSGVACILFMFTGLVVAGFLPPMPTSWSQAEVAAHYRENANAIRAGAALVAVASMFYVAFTAVFSGQMRRIPGMHPTVVYTQLAGGTLGCLTFLVPGLLFVVTAFRPERSPELTMMLNDMSWILIIMPFPPFMVQNFAFAYAIFSDKRQQPLFPRWLGYVNIWVPIMFIPVVIVPFFRSGPFAWSGIFGFWVPAISFGLQFITNMIFILRAINRPESEDAPQSSPGSTLVV